MNYTVAGCLSALDRDDLVKETCLGALSADLPITGVSCDNRRIETGNLFLCKGAAFKVQYLNGAMESGALFYVADRVWNEAYPHIIVKDVRLAMAAIAKWFFGEKVDELVIVGITGTKGKTTVSTLLDSILKNYAAQQGIVPPALISSLVTFDGKKAIPASLSTPEPFDLWRCLASACENGVRHAVCEVSSQGLKYHRTKGVPFDVALFLNIGEDHISDIEHEDFEDYFTSKLKIFEKAKVACIHSSTDYFDRVVAAAENAGCEVVTFGYRPEDTLYCQTVTCKSGGASFTVSWKNRQRDSYSIALSGRYNVDNALASLAAAYMMEVPYESIRNGIVDTQVQGRGVHLSTQNEAITVIVDYAHNKISMEALFEYVKEAFPEKKVVTVFGCPGGKAKNRREGMGTVSGMNSDYVIITEDDPDKESLADICGEIASFVDVTGTPYEIVYDRSEAIKKAFSVAKDGGVILLCGKGAEKTQKRGGQAIPYETDEYVAAQCICAYDEAAAIVS